MLLDVGTDFLEGQDGVVKFDPRDIAPPEGRNRSGAAAIDGARFGGMHHVVQHHGFDEVRQVRAMVGGMAADYFAEAETLPRPTCRIDCFLEPGTALQTFGHGCRFANLAQAADKSLNFLGCEMVDVAEIGDDPLLDFTAFAVGFDEFQVGVLASLPPCNHLAEEHPDHRLARYWNYPGKKIPSQALPAFLAR